MVLFMHGIGIGGMSPRNWVWESVIKYLFFWCCM